MKILSVVNLFDLSQASRWLIIGLVLLLLVSCNSQTTPKTTVTVFAAASLTEAFTDMADLYKSTYANTEVLLNFAGSQTLRLQLESGAKADLFASANEYHMQALVEAGLVSEPIIFTRNQLVVILPVGNPANIVTLADLADSGLKLVLAGPEVPVGRYSRQALTNLNADPTLGETFSERVLANLVSEEDNVKAVVGKVQLGEADAGIVYSSDVTPAVSPDLLTIAIPVEFNVVAYYPIALVANSEQPQLGRQFMELVLAPPGQAILAEHGFQPVSLN